MYYSYNQNTWQLTDKFNTAPTDGTPVLQSDMDYDLDNFDVIIRNVKDGVILDVNQPKPKPVPILIQNLQDLRKANEAAVQRLAEIQQHQAEAELETDYRLSLVELGLV